MLNLGETAESRDSLLSAGRRLIILLLLSSLPTCGSTRSGSYLDSSYSYETRSKLSFTGSATRMCYSCMSEDFLHHWKHLQELYYTPANFSDECYHIDHSTNKAGIGIVPCPSAFCITVIEPKILAGQRIGSNIIRGCISGVFRHTYRLPPPSSHQSDHECLSVSMRQLLPPHLASRSSNRTMNMCVCSGQLCNDFPSISNNIMSKSIFYAISLILFLINR
ncbi:hot-8 [Pristionchus pacificus]|nr:hot-8 [Pristionchus pacificus]